MLPSAGGLGTRGGRTAPSPILLGCRTECRNASAGVGLAFSLIELASLAAAGAVDAPPDVDRFVVRLMPAGAGAEVAESGKRMPCVLMRMTERTKDGTQSNR
jgi:hypothetical protein